MPRPPEVRDLEVLAAVGRFRMLTRPQLKRWFFSEVSEPIVSRFMARMAERGWLGVERLQGNGVQVAWLTRKGEAVLLGAGLSEADLFPATGPAAAKDFTHTVEIGNAAVWLSRRSPKPDDLLPAWHLQRLFGGRLAAIPDLLALWRPGDDTCGAALAVEIDLGTEPVVSVLLPKTEALGRVLTEWLGAGPAATLILVPGVRRRDSVRKALSVASIAAVVETLELTGAAMWRTRNR